MSTEKEKKPFKETKFAQFISKAAGAIADKGPDLLNAGLMFATQGPIAGTAAAIQALKGSSDPAAGEFLQELEARKMEFEAEMYSIEVEDRKSARSREVEMAKAGRSDWMMNLVGIIGLISFMWMIYGIMYIPTLEDNKLFIHLMGIIEGTVMVSLFAYYYGSSKGSADKTKLLGR